MRMSLTKSGNTRSSSKHTSSTASRSFNPHMNGCDFTSFKGNQQAGTNIDEDSRIPVTITSPSCFVMKVEYGILDVMTEMVKNLHETYINIHAYLDIDIIHSLAIQYIHIGISFRK